MSVGTSLAGGGGGGGGLSGPAPAASTDNAIVRWDGTGGTALQNSAVTVSDVAGAVVTVATTAGNALAIVATAPAATTGASQAGKAASLTASAAVASTDTAGAAVGGTATVAGGAAARNTSGNAAGGPVVLTGGAGIGTGAPGQVFVTQSGTKEVPSFAIGNATVGLYQGSQLAVQFSVNATNPLSVYEVGALLRSSVALGWSAGVPDTNGADVGIARVAANVLKLTTGGTTLGGWMQWAGQSYLAANATNATATMAATGLTVPVLSGRKYAFRAILRASDSTAADGAAFDFDTSAAATSFRATYNVWDGGTNIFSGGSVALATDIAAAIFDGSTNDGWVEVNGSYEPSADGNLLIRFSQVAHTAGTLTLFRGSHLLVWDMP